MSSNRSPLTPVRSTGPVTSGTRKQPRGTAFALLVAMMVLFLAAASAPTPLFASYRAEWGFDALTVTAVFGVYALAVLGALLTVGSLSDHIGRRPVLFAALALQVVAMLLFLTADDVAALLIARVVQGLATGTAVGALGAAMLDLDRERGAVANAVGAMAGTAFGALVAGLFVAFLPAPTHLVYAVILGLVLAQVAGVLGMAETVTPRPGALRSLRPQLGVPRAARIQLLVTLPTIVAVWALAGLYGSLGPAIAQTVVGSASPVIGGLGLFVLAGTGSITVLVTRNAPPTRLMTASAASLLAGVGLTEVALNTSSAPAFFAGVAIAGLGFGGGFQGALRTLVPLAQPQERASLLSAVFLASYVALGVPAIVAGVLVTHVGLMVTADGYTAVVILLATASLVATGLRWTLSGRREPRTVAARPMASD